MKTVTSTQLRTKSHGVYNIVTKEGAVRVDHRDREPMILISEEELKKRLEKARNVA